MNIDYCLIGQRIKRERNKAGMTQENLAEKLDVSVGYISQVERGITKISLDLLGRISAVFNCDIASLVTCTSIDNDRYLSDEITENIKDLSRKEKKLVLGIIDLFRTC